jgi:hypothetical protein
VANAKLVAKNWEGDELLARAARATGRGLVGIATSITSHAKVFVHEMSGDLRRSIHAAKPASSGQREARTGSDAKLADDLFLLEVGSWLDYACVEEVGRGHQFMQPAVETVSGAEAFATMKQAWMEEGL